MPVITQEEAAAPERRKRGARGLWLLLAPPLLALALLIAAAVQPLQLGPIVLVVEVIHVRGIGKQFVSNPVPAMPSTTLHNQQYVTLGGGHVWAATTGDWCCAVAWFRGHRLP